MDEFKVGDIVRHCIKESFGPGVILSIEGDHAMVRLRDFRAPAYWKLKNLLKGKSASSDYSQIDSSANKKEETQMQLFKVTVVRHTVEKKFVVSEELIVAVSAEAARMKSTEIKGISADDADYTTTFISGIGSLLARE